MTVSSSNRLRITFYFKMSELLMISQSAKKFTLAAHLGVSDISEAPATWFPRLREAQWFLCSLHMGKYHDKGGNYYLPVPCNAEVEAHNAIAPQALQWVDHNDPQTPVLVFQPGTTAVEIENIKMARQIYGDFQEMINDLFIQTVSMLGPSLRDELESEHAGGLPNLSNTQLQLWLYTRLGKPSEQDIKVLKASTRFRFSTSAQFGQDSAKLKTIYTTLNTLGFPTTVLEQMQQVEENVSHSAHMVAALERYKVSGDLDTRTYDAMVRFVIIDLQRLPETTTSQQGYVGAVASLKSIGNNHANIDKNIAPTGTSIVSSDSVIVQAPPFAANMFAEGGRRGGRGNRRGGGPGGGRLYGPAGRQPMVVTSANTTSLGPLKYCFAHGLNATHDGMSCFTMQKDGRYTMPMKQATRYCVIDNYQGAPDTIQQK